MAVVREIKYFDYMEAENKLGNAGYVKVDWWDASRGGRYRAEGALQIRLNHLPMEYIPSGFSGDEKTEIQLQTALGQIKLGAVEIKNGRGDFDCSLEVLQELLGDEITYEDIWSISIPLSGKHQVFCRIHELRMEPEQQGNMEEETATPVVQPVEWNIPDDADAEDGDTNAGDIRDVDAETPSMEVEAAELASTEAVSEQKREMGRGSYGEDKWSHLCSIYPKITPFSDSREYLKIGPNDFVVLNHKYYSLVHNSFMLHGYYQYGQLVLCRVLRRGKPLYYLGTPGIYLERDKQVALMYGFQSFECDNEPAGEGDFGYYMIQVEL